jgi:sigma-B regulation protein RsbQ
MVDIAFRNNVHVYGQGEQTLVLGHGFASDQNIWNLILPFFGDTYKIVVYDYVGSGESDKSAYNIDRYKDLRGYAQDLLEVLNATHAKNVIFVGHSISSMIGMLASIQNPELFKALIMIGPSPCYINQPSGYFGGFDEKDVQGLLAVMATDFVGWAKMNAAGVMNNPDRPNLAIQLETIFTAEDPAIMSHFAVATFRADHRAELSHVTVPTLILQCSEDAIVPPSVAHYLNDNIKNSQLVLAKAKGHYPTLSEPVETATIMLNYIQSLP